MISLHRVAYFTIIDVQRRYLDSVKERGVKSIVMLLFVNTAVFIGLSIFGFTKMDLRVKEIL